LVAEVLGGEKVAIPPTGGLYATLPVGRHAATFDEVYETFVEQAPFSDERQLIFDALRLYTRAVAREFTDLTLWINGGFVTHKTWAAPKDSDVAVVVPSADHTRVFNDPAASERMCAYQTVHNMTAFLSATTAVHATRLQPMAGLVDGFVIPDEPMQMALWDYRWSLVNDENGNLLPDTFRKGYLEVRP
jgi:hypothetical protein